MKVVTLCPELTPTIVARSHRRQIRRACIVIIFLINDLPKAFFHSDCEFHQQEMFSVSPQLYNRLYQLFQNDVPTGHFWYSRSCIYVSLNTFDRHGFTFHLDE